jgi:Asp-tRNA(Asn)/Glu-tRNA(Gln) amidotransferase A subunit family amidase
VCNASFVTYVPKDITAPRAAGALLKTAVALVENPVTAGAVVQRLLGDAGILAMREVHVDEAPAIVHPLFAASTRSTAELAPIAPRDALHAVGERNASAPFESIADFARAYRDGRVTPLQVAERVLAMSEIAQREGRAFFIAQHRDDVLAQARASVERHRENRSLGPLDGVPVAVKDELDQRDYPTTVGTRFLGTSPAREDATVVARLRASGAVLVGKTNMHEIGLGVTGVNPHHGAVRNPYDPTRITGGSSSGSAAVVAAGLTPLAVGADGGGSIRIPASLCGVAGLKATFGRVSEHGAAPLCWSVAHVGPIGATVADVAIGYGLMAGTDGHDANTYWQPAPTLDGVANADLTGVRVGVFRPWFEHASPAIVTACTRAIDALRAMGATIVDVEIPDLELVRVAHLITIVAEMATAHVELYRKHRTAYAHDTRLNLAIARALQGFDVIHASRIRTRIARHFADVLRRVDVIATPTTACTAPPIAPDSLATGESNLTMTDQIMRFAPVGNLAGLPALTLPVGYDAGRLPIGLQLMGRAWDEALLLRMGLALEPRVERRPPRVHTRLLER